MLNKYDDKKAKILEENIQSVVIMMTGTSKELWEKMGTLEDLIME